MVTSQIAYVEAAAALAMAQRQRHQRHVGWLDYHLLTDQAHPELTPEGTSEAPIPVYGADGTTVIGKADVSQPYRP